LKAEGTPLLGLPLGGRPARRFLIVFALMAGTLLALYYFPHRYGGAVSRVIDAYLHFYAVVTGAILRIFEPALQVVGNDIVGRFELRVEKTCDAADVDILFVSAVAAWPGPWRARLVGALAGVALLAAVNIARICSLYYVGLHFPSSFTAVHLEIWPIAIVVVAIAAFLFFARKVGPGGAHRA
jgi:exosortase/archaeosortase family protein